MSTATGDIAPLELDVEMKACDNSGGIEDNLKGVKPDIAADPSKFLRQSVKEGNVTSGVDELMEQIRQPLLQKEDKLAKGSLGSEKNGGFVELTLNKSRLKERFGFDTAGSTYLWPEEVLYLIETGKLEVYCDKIALSAQRARSLFLRQDSDPENPFEKIKTCTLSEYSVYKHLTKLGYQVRRRPIKVTAPKPFKKRTDFSTTTANVTTNVTLDESDETLDQEEVMVLEESETIPPPGGGVGIEFMEDEDSGLSSKVNPSLSDIRRKRRGEKRSASNALLTDDDSSSSSHLSFKQDVDKYYEDMVSKIDENIESDYGGLTASLLTTDEEMSSADAAEPLPGPSTGIRVTPGDAFYIVSEVDSDSDVEILEEVFTSHKNVVIEEILGYDGDVDEGSAHASVQGAAGRTMDPTGSNVIVDLVSSDEGSDNEGLGFDKDILSTFIPNARIELQHPPPHLLPHNIPARSNQTYKFHLKNKETMSGDLENIVEDLNLGASPKKVKSEVEERVKCNSWKEWRQLAMAEAMDVRKESLLANSSRLEDTFNKLHLWGDSNGNGGAKGQGLDPNRLAFNLYAPSSTSVKYKAEAELPPDFHLVIVKNEEEILRFKSLSSIVDDQIPFLFAVVSDEAQPLFITSNLQSLPNLF